MVTCLISVGGGNSYEEDRGDDVVINAITFADNVTKSRRIIDYSNGFWSNSLVT